MKTAMQELIEFEQNVRDRFGWKLTAYQVLKLVQKKMNRLLEKEKKQIINAHYDSAMKIIEDVTPEILESCKNDFEDAEKYFKETFKS